MKLVRLALVCLACAFLASPAAAVTAGFAPPGQSVGLGDVIAVDVVFGDLGDEIISAYDLDITYDASILDATGVIFTSALGDELFFEAFNAYDLGASGVVDLAQLSLLPDAVLDALQTGDSVHVATLVFDAVGVGATDLGFVFDEFNDVKGRDAAILPILADTGRVVVEGVQTPIPEPSAALLFLVGSLVLRRRS